MPQTEAREGPDETRTRFPQRLRLFVRTREAGLFLVALAIGLVGGVAVAALGAVAQWMHETLFALPAQMRLSAASIGAAWRVVAATTAGGLALAALIRFVGPKMRGLAVDVVEANALHGGRMSMRGSLYIVAQTLASNGFGLSVGLEAAYTQLAGAVGSQVAEALKARRGDHRLFVACGAAAGIAAAFDAPFTGAFYAFETVLGVYSVASLAPVAGAAMIGAAVANRLTPHERLAPGASLGPLAGDLFAQGALLGHVVVIAALATAAGVALMLSVGACQRVFDRALPNDAARLALAGAMVGVIGWISPTALGAGHAALALELSVAAIPPATLAAALALKAGAVTLSLGGGFRGGLFFASFFIGGLIGRLYGVVAAEHGAALDPHSAALAMIAMAAMGACVIGAPVAMTAFVFEMTGDPATTLAALAAASLAALTTRETFGYSFATWRFHLRGETIRGPLDVGWVRDLKVGRLMRRDMKTLSSDRSIAAARIMAPIGSAAEVFLVDDAGRYAGLVSVSRLHTVAASGDEPISTLAQLKDVALTPATTIRQALDVFERAESDRLAVVEEETRKLVGQVTEGHLLRRYGVELERRNNETARG